MLVTALSFVAARPSLAEPPPPPPRIAAAAAVLVDWESGRVLFEKSARQPFDPASTTKVITALIALEQANLSDLVTVSRRAAATGGSSFGLRAGERVLLADLIKGMLLRSGNDAAVAIAEHVAGSVEAFAALMNDRARALGALKSSFKNPHGLTEAGHVSTAYDLALIARAAMQNAYFRSVVSAQQLDAFRPDQSGTDPLSNTNKLLWMYDLADGVKTGTTAAAGNCLVASASDCDQRLIAVVLDSPNRWREARELLEWGFQSFDRVPLLRAGEVVTTVSVRDGLPRRLPLVASRDLSVLVPHGRSAEVMLEVQADPEPKPPLREGTLLGEAYAKLAGEVIGQVTLLAAAPVEPAGLWARFLDWLRRLRRP